jgi:putative SOS response-associated peptidase YedK
LRCGLVSYWVKSINVGFANINEGRGPENRPAFRKAFHRRRCFAGTSTKKTTSDEQLYAVAPADRGLRAVAGLWENWRSPAGEWMRSFAIITTKPNELCAELHNSIPMVSAPEAWPVWLAEEAADQSQLKALLAPYPSDRMTCWSVSAGWQRQE